MTASDDQQRRSNFYSVLNQTLHSHREATRRLDRFLSTDFNVFKWIESDENRLSDIIADLLNPSGSHGQNRRFLDAFLEIIKRPDLKAEQLPKVGREVLTTHNRNNPYRRIDIVVEFGNDSFGLGIENKPEADDQEQQLKDYSYHLQEKYKGKFCLIYLTWEGHRDPPETSIGRRDLENLKEKEKLICISYNPDIRKWIEECCRICESDRFRWFLRDFMDYINGGQTMSMRNEREIILKHALKEENLETALDINTAFNGDLHGRIIVGFLDKLKKFVLGKLSQRSDGSQWEVNNKTLLDSPWPKYADFSFGKKSWEEKYGVGLQLQPPKDNEDRDRKVMIGVWKPKNDLWPGDLEDRLRNKLNRRFGLNGKQAKEWPWYHYLNDPYWNWNAKKTLIKLHNGEAVKYIGGYIVNIIELAAPIIDKHVKQNSQ